MHRRWYKIKCIFEITRHPSLSSSVVRKLCGFLISSDHAATVSTSENCWQLWWQFRTMIVPNLNFEFIFYMYSLGPARGRCLAHSSLRHASATHNNTESHVLLQMGNSHFCNPKYVYVVFFISFSPILNQLIIHTIMKGSGISESYQYVKITLNHKKSNPWFLNG